jgi:hypothetical protein
MQCFWGLEAGVAALGVWRYRHVRRTAHRDLVFELEEEEDWFAFERAPAPDAEPEALAKETSEPLVGV